MEGFGWDNPREGNNFTNFMANVSTSALFGRSNYSDPLGYARSHYPGEPTYFEAGDGGGGGETSESFGMQPDACIDCVQSPFYDTSLEENYTMRNVINVSKTGIVPELNHNEHSGDDLYEVPLSIIIFLSLLYGGISVAALVGNLLVLWVVSVSNILASMYCGRGKC